MSLYSIVVPVYNSEHTLEELYERLKKVFEETICQPFELILVDDSSRDRSYEIMQKLRAADSRVKIIQMAKNFGQHPALLCGFRYAKGDFVITMDDDLQHPPEEIPKLVNTMNERDDVDVIIAKYEGRKHNFIRRLGTKVSVYATSKMLHKDPNLEITSFRLIRKFIVDAILQTNTHLPQIGNLLVLTSNRIINVPIRHDSRAYGKSGYSFRALAKSLIYDITTNSAFPLVVVRDIGVLSFLLSVILGIYYLCKSFFVDVPVEGFTTLVLLILGFSGLILLSIGVIGIYLMNILEEAKKMPNYVTRRVEIDDTPVGKQEAVTEEAEKCDADGTLECGEKRV
ncbi:MAG: glycosyltransferase family 2 protein [Candidatus Choladocola sp.]|nr:glycosyltransferase family 2 protein [Candidatus Choladocola sp.]